MDIAGPRITAFPETGTSADDLLAEIDDERAGDIDWRSGRAFSLVYHHDDEELEGLQHDVADRFLHENALNPFAYRTPAPHGAGGRRSWPATSSAASPGPGR